MSEAAVDRAVAALERALGFRVDATMRGRVHAHVRGLPGDVDSWSRRLDDDPVLLQELVDAMTVRETSFFRDPAQFEAFAEHVIPHAPGPLLVWSAGCSNGQEIYSLAMLLDEHGRGDARLVASDVSTLALERTRAGRYQERELRGLDDRRRERWLERDGDDWVVHPALRRRVEVVPHNLSSSPPPVPPAEFTVVFCRNVLIYFRPDEVVRTLGRLHAWLPVGGRLFLGFSESLWQVTDLFALERLGNAFVYHKTSTDDSRRPPARSAAPARQPAQVRPAARPRPPAKAPAKAPAKVPVPAAAGAPGEHDVVALRRAGELATAAGEHADAVRSFRQATFLEPEDPLSHLELGLALEAAGDPVAARRAFLAARHALHRSDAVDVSLRLDGYRPEALEALIDSKLPGGRP